MRIGDAAADFEAETPVGPIRFHQWLGGAWAIIFSHPKDFTPVCAAELGYTARLKPEFDKRNVKIIGLSVDPAERHDAWAKNIEETQGAAVNCPTIGDPSERRAAADNPTARSVYVVGPDTKIRPIIAYPMTTGRNFDEVLRVGDSPQLSARRRIATPANGKRART